MTKILVLSRGVVGRDMASTGIRCYHMARVLADQIREAQVTLVVPNEPDIPSPHERVRMVRQGNPWRNLRLMFEHDIIIARDFPGYAIALLPSKQLVLDAYATSLIEWLPLSERILDKEQRKLWLASRRHYVLMQLTLADYIACSDERQRDYWVGALSIAGLIPPETYDRDTTLHQLVGVAPYGVQPGRPRKGRRVLKGVVPGIRKTDKVVIWNGSIMEWLDAETVIRAMAEVSRVRDDVKLFFLGVEHPDWVTGLLFHVPQEAVKLSEELGLYNQSVFFKSGWVPYDDIGDYLAEADIGVCTGFDSLEARYAYRTRFVDLFWAQLPIVCTQGDVLAERVEQAPLGVAVPERDVQAVAAGIIRLVDDEEFYRRCKSNLLAVKKELSWERVLAPIVEYVRNPQSIAADKRQRLLPLLQRTAAYEFSRGLEKLSLFMRKRPRPELERSAADSIGRVRRLFQDQRQR